MPEDSDADVKVDAQEPENAVESTGDELVVGRWTSVRAVWLNALALAVVLVVTLLLVNNGSIAIYDEAVYAAQAQALVDGSWVSERSAADLDPEGKANLLLDSTIVGDGAIAYSRHPLYPLLLVPLTAIGGYSASLLLSVFGVVSAAVCAAFLARRVDPRYGLPALWLAGVASPLVIDSVVLWAHGLAAATAGLTMLGALRAMDGKRAAWNLCISAAAAILTALLRTEGVIFVAAVGSVICARSIRWRSPRSVNARVLAMGITLGSAGVAAYFFDTWWSRHIGGSGGYGTNVSNLVLGEQAGPLSALWSSVLRPGRELIVDVTPILTGTSIFLVLGALAVRFRVPWRAFPWGLFVLGAIGWVWAAVAMTDTGTFFVSGLLPAFPALLFGVLAVGRAEVRQVEIATSVAVALVCLGVSLLFVHSQGGTEWGGRFFHVLLVPAIAPIVAVMDRSRGYFNASERRLLVVPLVVLLLAPSLSALKFVDRRKVVIERQVNEVVRRAQEVSTVGHRPLIIIWRFKPTGASRQLWEQRETLDILAPLDHRGLIELLNRPAVVDRRQALFVTDVPPGLLNEALKGRKGDVPWTADESRATTDQLSVLVPIQVDASTP